MVRFELPDIGEGVVEAEILDWKVQEGELVKEDQILVELLTDKAEIEIPSPYSGRVQRICFQVGEIAPVGAVLIEIDEDGSGPGVAVPTPTSPPKSVETAAAPASGSAHPPALPERPRSQQKASERPERESVDAVPAVRDLARRLDVDLDRVQGSGPGGRIMRRDVERAQRGGDRIEDVEQGPASVETTTDPEDWERRPFRGLRRAIARRMVQARRTAAHFTYVEEVDLTDLLAASEHVAESSPRSPLPFIAHATLRSLARSPVLNASIDDEREEMIFKAVIHLGIATATDDGLVVPVIHEAARFSVAELAEEIDALARKAREGRLTPGELRGSTFTITSLGKLGGVMSTPILNYPEVAILGVGALRSVPVLRGTELEARSVLNLSISVDHRITDGLEAARFVADLKAKLEGVDFPGFAASRSQA